MTGSHTRLTRTRMIRTTLDVEKCHPSGESPRHSRSPVCAPRIRGLQASEAWILRPREDQRERDAVARHGETCHQAHRTHRTAWCEAPLRCGGEGWGHEERGDVDGRQADPPEGASRTTTFSLNTHTNKTQTQTHIYTRTRSLSLSLSLSSAPSCSTRLPYLRVSPRSLHPTHPKTKKTKKRQTTNGARRL